MKWLWLSAAVLMLDRFTKMLAEHYLAGIGILALFPGLNLVLVHNPGAAFGLLAAGGWQRWFLLGTSVLFCVLILGWMLWDRRPYARSLRGALALVLGGAAGNLWDRLAQGRVTDFIDLYLLQWHWPTFNLADAAITVGVVVLLLQDRIAPLPTGSRGA